MAQTQKYLGRRQLHLKEETTQDTYIAPATDGTGMILAENVAYTIDSQMRDANYVRAGGQQSDPIRGTWAATITFDVLLKGSGTAGTAPEFTEALKACGLEHTNTPVTSDEFTPLLEFDGAGGSPGPSYSVSIIEDGPTFSLKGGFGNVAFSGVVGDAIVASFTFQGAGRGITAGTLEVGDFAPAYQTTIAPAFMGATMSFQAVAEGAYPTGVERLGVENFTLDCGNNVVLGRDVNAAFGIYGARIVSRRSTGSFDPEMVAVATQDWFEHWEEAKPCTLETGEIGGTAGNKVKFEINRLVFGVPELVDRNEIRALNIPFAITSLPTDEEGDANEPDWKLTFT